MVMMMMMTMMMMMMMRPRILQGSLFRTHVILTTGACAREVPIGADETVSAAELAEPEKFCRSSGG
eukprot:12383099-Karenia_brevis.AAC.1